MNPLLYGPKSLFSLFLQKQRKRSMHTKCIQEAITGGDLMCRMCNINHIVRLIDKLQQHTPGSCSAAFNGVWQERGGAGSSNTHTHTHTHTQRLSAHEMKSSRSSCRRADILPPLRPALRRPPPPSPLFIRKSSSRLCPCALSPFWDQLCFLSE